MECTKNIITCLILKKHLCMYLPVKKIVLYWHLVLHFMFFISLPGYIGLPHVCFVLYVLDLYIKELLLYFPAACFFHSLLHSWDILWLVQCSSSFVLHCSTVFLYIVIQCGVVIYPFSHSRLDYQYFINVSWCTCMGASLGRSQDRIAGSGFPALIANAKLSS